MSERESEDERAFTSIAEAAGWFTFKLEKANKNGLPDRWYLKDGVWVLLEWKSTFGTLKPVQAYQRQKILEHKGVIFTVHNSREAKIALGIV